MIANIVKQQGAKASTTKTLLLLSRRKQIINSSLLKHFFSTSKIEERISILGHQLPSASTPAGSYISCVRSGNMIYTAGHLPFDVNGELITGKVGKDVTEEEAAHAACNQRRLGPGDR